MENNTEEKKRFFAQYYGQEVQTTNSSGEINWMFFKHWKDYKDICWIPLKSLSAISDEDALEVIKRLGYQNTESYKGLGPWVFRNELDNTTDIPFGVADYLRKNGYALEYDDIPVEEQIYKGWVKIKQ